LYTISIILAVDRRSCC